MFTGIIENIGSITSIEDDGENKIISIQSTLSNELRIDQSVAHNGICLTVIQCNETSHTICAVPETITKTSISNWKVEDALNIERCIQLQNRIDGHIVQGHIDCTATCIYKKNNSNSWIFTFEYPYNFAHLVVEKGSITVNGISLTCYNLRKNTFDVSIIPYTYNNTTIHNTEVGTIVNIEFDIIGKYFARSVEVKNN